MLKNIAQTNLKFSGPLLKTSGPLQWRYDELWKNLLLAEILHGGCVMGKVGQGGVGEGVEGLF